MMTATIIVFLCVICLGLSAQLPTYNYIGADGERDWSRSDLMMLLARERRNSCANGGYKMGSNCCGYNQKNRCQDCGPSGSCGYNPYGSGGGSYGNWCGK